MPGSFSFKPTFSAAANANFALGAMETGLLVVSATQNVARAQNRLVSAGKNEMRAEPMASGLGPQMRSNPKNAARARESQQDVPSVEGAGW